MFWSSKTADEDLFDHWVEQHHAALYKHALWLIGDVHTAEDLVQETYYQAWRSFQNIKDARQAFAWLLTILRRMVYREYSRNQRHADLRQNLQALELDGGSSASQPEVLDLLRAMSQLSAEQRDTLLMSTLHGFSYEEISAQLEVPVGTVMSRISRARQKLNAVMNADSNLIRLDTCRNKR